MSYFTTPSRSSSLSSITSTTSIRRPSADDLSSAARTIIESLSSYSYDSDSDSDDLSIISTLTALISPDLTAQHDDQEPLTSRDAYLASWRSRSSASQPVRITVKEACVDEVQSKVWVRSEIRRVDSLQSEESGVVEDAAVVMREAVDMMTFDEEGLLVSKVGYERRVRRRSDDED